MNSTATVDLLDIGPTAQALVSCPQFQTHEIRPNNSFSWLRVAKIAGFAISLTVSSVTAISDPWYLDKRRRDAVVTVSIYREIIGRPISRFEALQIARQILEEAEQERLAAAELEAAQGIQWGTSYDL